MKKKNPKPDFLEKEVQKIVRRTKTVGVLLVTAECNRLVLSVMNALRQSTNSVLTESEMTSVRLESVVALQQACISASAKIELARALIQNTWKDERLSKATRLIVNKTIEQMLGLESQVDERLRMITRELKERNRIVQDGSVEAQKGPSLN